MVGLFIAIIIIIMYLFGSLAAYLKLCLLTDDQAKRLDEEKQRRQDCSGETAFPRDGFQAR